MSILLTGGSGFIGSYFHSQLLHSDIINLDLHEPRFINKATFVQGDIRKEEDIRMAVRGREIKTIISLAAKHHDFGIGHDEYFDTNEDGTKALCAVASEFGINEIIFYSSVAVYGTRDVISTEELIPQPDSPYGASKLAGEKVLKAWAADNPQRKVLIIRPTVAFGPGNVANMFNLIKQIDSRLYFHLGKANTVKSIAYVENLVAGTLFLKSKMTEGVLVYNYADEPQLTTRQIAEEISNALGKKIRFTVPLWIALTMAFPFDLVIKLTGKNLPISTARVKKLATQTHHSAQRIFSEGFTPRYTTQQGLQKMVAWYRTATKQS